MSTFTRRSFIGKTAVAIGSFAALQKMVGAGHPTDPGPANPALDGQSPDSIWPPGTDSKSLVQNFKYPFSFANKRVYDGGWSPEVTVRKLPVSKTMAGVNMRLTVGAFRELHWHTAGEWAIMLYGSARITAINVFVFMPKVPSVPIFLPRRDRKVLQCHLRTSALSLFRHRPTRGSLERLLPERWR